MARDPGGDKIRAGSGNSPEPATNVVVSLVEDGFVVGLVLLLLTHPILGLSLALLALIAILVVLVLLLRLLFRRKRVRT